MEFNTLKNFKSAKKFQKKLLDNNFTLEQTDVIIEGLMEIIEDAELVTKPFLKTALAELRTELKTDQVAFKAEVKTEIAEKIAKSEKKLLLWMVSLQVTTLGIVIAILALVLTLMFSPFANK